jgi:hypothetical protein
MKFTLKARVSRSEAPTIRRALKQLPAKALARITTLAAIRFGRLVLNNLAVRKDN